MNQAEEKRQRLKTQINREELIELLCRILPYEGILEVFPSIFLSRSSKPMEKIYSVFKPAFCVIAQGSKDVLLGEEVFRYDQGHYLISTVDLPIVSHIVEASEDKPYLNLRIDLDPAFVSSVMIDAGIGVQKNKPSIKAMDVSPLDADLLDAVAKLVRLIDKPDEIRFFAPFIIREIIYRLLRGEQGTRLSHLIASEGDAHRISRAVKQIQENYEVPLRIDHLARQLGMSVSGFHSHFKSVTAMSPLQFQKQIRLQEARRLMLGEDLDVANAGFRVGYEDPSYFSREYKKLFGAPPHRDISRMRSKLEV